MMIAGDWGTTSLRLYLCNGDTVVDRAQDAGVGETRVPAADIFQRAVAPWRARFGRLPAVLCGMVGSNLGWAGVPYVVCPAAAPQLHCAASHLSSDTAPVAIQPGLRCINPLGAPDVMRGEETQIFGALAAAPALARGQQILVLPGTHTKWVVVQDGTITTFLTAFTGELFGLLQTHGTLCHGTAPSPGASPIDFSKGLRHHHHHAHVAVTHMMFQARSRQIVDGVGRDAAMAYLSGLLIGADVASGLAQFGASGPTTLIGAPQLTALYKEAFQLLGTRTQVLDGELCSRAGLRASMSADAGAC